MGVLVTYRLPLDMPVQIAFSGGRSSAYMLDRILDAHGGVLPENAHVLFQNTGRERAETLDFVAEYQARRGVRIVWLERRQTPPHFEIVNHNSASRNGEPFEALVMKRKYLPNVFARFCTQELKVRPARDYMRSVGADRWRAYIGIRYDERHRAANSARNASRERWTIRAPMVRARVTSRDVADYWAAQPFDLRLRSVNGVTPQGNCDGCFQKSELERARVARYEPEIAAWWARMESATGGTFDKRTSWRALIEHAGRQGDWVFDAESAEASPYCSSSMGGCHD